MTLLTSALVSSHAYATWVTGRGILARVLAGEKAAGKRAPDQRADSRGVAVGQHLVLGLAADHRVVDLPGDERRVALQILDALSARGVPSREVRPAHVPHHAARDEIVERAVVRDFAEAAQAAVALCATPETAVGRYIN
jgi:hypothetical protein